MTAEEMFRRKIEIDGIKERRDALRDSINEQRKAYQEKTKQLTDELRGKALDSVKKTVPNFSEDFIKKAAKSEGFTDAEIDGVLLDPRSAKVLWKAAQYDQLQSAKTEAIKKASTAPPMLKPGSANPMSPDVKSDLAMRKQQAKATTSAEKARIIQRRLEQRF